MDQNYYIFNRIMALNAMRPLLRDFRMAWNVRHYSRRPVFREDESDKSQYQREEEGGQKTRIIHGQEYPDWRQPMLDRQAGWNSKLKMFLTEKNPHPEILSALNKLPKLTVAQIKNWWSEMKEVQTIENQRFKSERVEILGANIGAAHFFLFRKATIRLKGSKTWLKGDPTLDEVPSLPDRFEDGFFVEAIDASTFSNGGLRYEGLENMANCNLLKWLSLQNNSFIDEWCLDRIAGQNGHSLEYLDLRGCKVNPGGIIALARMKALKVLLLSETQNKDIDIALSALEEQNPNLMIKLEQPSEPQALPQK